MAFYKKDGTKSKPGHILNNFIWDIDDENRFKNKTIKNITSINDNDNRHRYMLIIFTDNTFCALRPNHEDWNDYDWFITQITNERDLNFNELHKEGCVSDEELKIHNDKINAKHVELEYKEYLRLKKKFENQDS